MVAKSGFVLRYLVGEYILVPTGNRIKEFRNVLLLNELSAFIWEKIQTDISKQNLLEEILTKYEIDEQTAYRDLENVLEKMIKIGIINM